MVGFSKNELKRGFSGDGIVSDEQIRRWWDRTAAQIDARNQEKWRKEYSALGGASEGLTLDKMDQVAVQKAIVPDAAFRTLVKQFDVDGNGKIDERGQLFAYLVDGPLTTVSFC